MLDWRLKRQAIKAGAFLLSLCFVVAAYVIYLSVWEADDLKNNPYNKRSAFLESQIKRGRILSIDKTTLAYTDDSGRRMYPLGEITSPVVGYNIERLGNTGIEARCNQPLLGLTDEMVSLGPLAQALRSENGNDVITTIELEMQKAAYNALSATGKRGAAVAIDADSGAVLAMVSLPSYDASDLESKWKDLKEREDSPLLNRAVQGLYPPGSTIKPLIALAALREEVTDEDEMFSCDGLLDVGGGATIRESHGQVHGKLNLQDALVYSCNTTFGTLGMRLGKSGLKDILQEVGFGETLEGDVLVAASHLPDFTNMGKGELAQIALGQGKLLTTPMQMALLAAAFISDGKMPQPYLVESIVSSSGISLFQASTHRWKKAFSAYEASEIADWLEDVVKRGTGTAASIGGIRVIGKTGTAENASGADHAWFMGAAEVSMRRIAFAVIVENGGSGGQVAAPIAREMIGSLL